jgi:hypothetical protein
MEAQGGPVKKQAWGIRGEKGCELFIPAQPGTVIRHGHPLAIADRPDLTALLKAIKSSEGDES